MTHPPMTLQRFLRLVEAYGSQLSRFPEAERGAAEALLRISEPARAALTEEAGLDSLLDTFTTPDLSPALLRKINEIPVRMPVTRRARWPLQRLWAPAFGWAAAAALGVILGTTIAENDDAWSDSSDTDAQTSAEQSPSDEALAELALGSFADFEETP